jgi:hypothetical protein
MGLLIVRTGFPFSSPKRENHRGRTLSIAAQQVNKDPAHQISDFPRDFSPVGMTVAVTAKRLALLDFGPTALILAVNSTITKRICP